MTDDMQNWVGRCVTTDDVLRAAPAQFMQATLDHVPSLSDGDVLPPLWHWLYFLQAARASDLGRDAHPKRGGFLPPVTLPRRMWAGGRLTFHTPLIVGQAVRKSSVIKSVVEKTGRTGRLCFVTVEHSIFQGDVLAMVEDHDIVYRDDPDPQAPSPDIPLATDAADVSECVTPNPALLFRYSALTFNGHRIHYDLDYAKNVEGYDGLVFHGPLIATLLAGLGQRVVGQAPKTFAYRGVSPVVGMTPFYIEAKHSDARLDLWARDADGRLVMTAQAQF